mgnify:CR=1 FL=1
MKTSSAKAKGRRLQQTVAELLRSFLNLSEQDIKSTPMGTQGVDVWMSNEALRQLPLSIECKNVEKIQIWKAIEQAETNAVPGTIPVVVFCKNNASPQIVVPLLDFLALVRKNGTKVCDSQVIKD